MYYLTKNERKKIRKYREVAYFGYLDELLLNDATEFKREVHLNLSNPTWIPMTKYIASRLKKDHLLGMAGQLLLEKVIRACRPEILKRR